MKTDVEDIVACTLVISIIFVPFIVSYVSGLTFDVIQNLMSIAYAILTVIGLIYYIVLLNVRK